MNANNIPAGFVLVPREITPAMIEAWVEAHTFERGYRAMLDAAPSTADPVAHETPNASDNGACVQPASGEVAVGAAAQLDAMVTAYLEANDAYWRKTDKLPLRPGEWRAGTAREATRISLLAALAAATPASPQAPAPQAVVGEASEVPAHWPTAWRDVVMERHRQTVEEGWTARHDDKHVSGSMALAAACYACNSASWAQRDASIPAADYAKFAAPGFRWPWAMKWWKPKSQRQDLIRAGALILAEVERLDRRETRK